MSTSHIKYEQPASGTGLATETFTEDSITKHFERIITGYKPNDITSTQAGVIANEGTLDLAPCISLVDGTSNNWTASSGDAGAYYYTPSGIDFDSILITGVEVNGSMITEGTAGSLANNEYAVTDQDTLGANTLYIQLAVGDPDGQTSGYVKLHYALPCAGASVIRVAPVFSNSSETGTVVPVLYQTDDPDYPMALSPVSLEESGISIPNAAGLLGYPGNGFDIDVKGAKFFAIGIKTGPTAGTLEFLTWVA